jgi:putative DNA primase/helicase
VPACEPSTCTLHPATSHSPAPSVPNPSIQQSINPSIHEAIARLAKLSRLDYDLARRAEAKRLQLRLATLDDAVDRARIVEDDAQADAYVLPQLKPWPEPILDAPALFDQVHERYLLYLYLPPGADVVLTLWPAHAAAVGAFCHTPRLNLTSSEPGCGKTTALDLTTALIPKVLRTDHMKPAVMFRVIHREGPARPAVLLDELDAYLRLYPELRGLINAGHSPGACVYRCEGGTVRSFQIFAATALAGLGTLTPTLRDRSIVIHLVKAPPGTLKARFDKRHVEAENLLGSKIARWTKDNFAAIAACDPVMPPAAYNRLGDNWRPLIALAQVIGGHWPALVADAFAKLTAKPPTQDKGKLLLADIRRVFADAALPRLFSTDLLHALCSLPERPYSYPDNLKPSGFVLTPASLARLLQPYGIRPHAMRIGDDRTKGYELAQFEPVFKRLLNGDNHDEANGPPTA